MSRYDGVLDDMAGELKDDRNAASIAAQQHQPDAYAKALDLSRETGAPAQTIARNPAPFERKVKQQKYDQILDGAPTVGEWLTNVDNATVAQDDVESISGLEKALRSVADVGRSVPAGGYQAVGGSLSGLGAINDAMGRVINRGIRATGLESVADFLETPVPAWMDPGRVLKSIGGDVKAAGDAIGAPKERQNLATDIGSGLGQVSAQIAFQLVTGGTSSLVSLAGQGADQQVDRAAAAGATQEQQDAAVLAGATITAVTERYGLEALLDRVAPSVKNAVLGKLTDVLIAGGQEALQEATEGVLHNLTAAALYDPSAPLFQGIERDAEAAGATGAVARAILSALLPGHQNLSAVHERRTAEDIAKIAQESKLATRSPAKLEDLVAKIKEATGTDHAYVDAEAFRTLFQSDQEAADAATAMTGNDQTYFEAAVSGGRMAIPLEKYVTQIAANKESAKLLDHFAFSPDGLTAAEAKESKVEFDDQAQKIAQSYVDEARPDASQTVYDDVLGQLMQTGMERSTAEKNAALMQTVFRSLGQRTGVDPQQLYARYGLKINRAGMEAVKPKVDANIDPMIDRLRSGDIPTEAAAQKALEAGDSGPMNLRSTLVQLGDYLGAQGVDLKTADNAAVKTVLAKQELDQRFEETKRGSIQFGADRQFTINLFEKADLSTALHESGHFYLEVMGDLAESAEAPQQVKEDFAAILKWTGAKDRAGIQTKHHEQFARGFEAYLMEGKSPSVEMQTVFARFRAWLTAVYRTLSKLNVELTDEVRGVMDRLVATDEEISAAEESQNYAPIFTLAEDAGMSPEQWSAYQAIAIKAHHEAVEDMTDRAMKQLTREQKAWWKEERTKVIETVTAEVNQQPVYQALSFLQKGTNSDGSALADGVQAVKLNKAALADKYGKDFLKRLPRGITAKDGVSADTAASLFGFNSGDAMVEALANARPKQQLIEMEADARMREAYGDMLTDGSLAEEAMKSVHTDGRSKVMAAELKALNRKRREVAPFVKASKDENERKLREAREANEASIPKGDDLKAIKAAVVRIIGAKKVRDIQPNQYRMAEAKAARKAFELAGKGKFEEAYIEKRKQILNHELYREATKAREEVDGIVEYMRGFDKKSTREKIAKAKGQYLEQIDALRERFDFSKVSNIADLKRDALAKWVAAQEAAGRETNVPEYLLDESRKTPYKELLLAELQGLNDAVKNIEHLAKTKDRLLKNKAAAEWQDAKAELLDRVQTSLPPGKAPPLGRFDMSKWDALGDKAHEIADSLLRPETIIEWLDGGTQGPWHDYLWNQANDSQDRREAMRDRVAKPLFDLAQKITRKRRNELQEMVQIPSMARPVNRRTLISIALNMGNASNLDKLTRGGYRTAEGSRAFTQQNLDEIKAALSAEDWQFVQTVWNTVEQLWPDVVEFQKRMGGLVPEKIEATPVVTPHGTFTGGYFPLVYDPEVSAQGEKQAAGDSVQEILGNNFTKASTKKGHTKERTTVARPVLLDFERVVTRHMDQVITDLSHREFLLQATKVLEDAELRAQIQNRVGDTAYRSLQGMVRHAVRADSYYGDPASSAWMRMQDFVIRNTAVGALGFRAVTAFGNLILAPVQAAARIPTLHILKGIGSFYRAPRDMTAFIHGQSSFMKHRAENLDSSLVETMATLRGERSVRAQIARAAMAVHRWSDFLGTHGLWLGKFQEMTESGSTPEEATREADKAIRQTQTAGAPKDLSAFERDPTYKAFRMFLGPMLIMGNRIRESVGRKGVVKNWPEAFGTMFAVWFIPALLWEVATGKGPDGDDEPEDIALWSLRKLFFYPFMTVPFLRDIANGVERKISGQYSPSRSVPLAEAGELVVKAGEEWFKAGEAIAEGDDIDTAAFVKDNLRATGPLLGLPAVQLDVTGQFLFDTFSGEYDPEGVGDLRYLAIKRK